MSVSKRKRQRGNALVEFAIGWSVLWAIFAGVWQFGYSFYIYNLLQTAVADAAELGAKMDYDIADTANPTQFQQKLQNMVVYADETAGTNPIVPGIAISNVSVAVTLDSQSMPRAVTVSITNYRISAVIGNFMLINKPRATTKYYGTITCSTC
ncbi:MAG TPA: TadE/TadG family type IV pilus assembly protein [Bryobacteraceae bacterium]|nr:TadE/TadG family type IV pilus assembly protein [Bryobacteraceae bacterium]